MRRVGVVAALCGVAIATPAWAEMEYKLPIGYRSLTLDAPGGPIEAKGGFVPVFWFGGPMRFFSLRFEAGGSYMVDGRGAAQSYAVGQAVMNFELPLGFATPYVGVVGHAAYPILQPPDVVGIPYGYMPQVGLHMGLLIVDVDLHVGRGPVYGLSRPGGAGYEATMTEVGAKVVWSF